MEKIKDIFYNPDIILSKTDLNGENPSIYLISGNRSAGKTTGFLKKSLEWFKESGKQTILLYRYRYELNSAHEIYKDVLNIYPDLGTEMTSVSKAQGLFYELVLNEKTFGYAIALTNVDAMKKYSPLFADCEFVIFDEFQKEDGKYLPKEIEKFQSILVTVARGGGQMSRKIKVFLLGNLVSIMNPYFINLGIHKRLKKDTHFMRGNGWIAEFIYNANASKAIKENGIFKAFASENYMTYSTENVYLHDALVFCDKPKGKSRYICTIIHDGTSYGVREYYEDGILYVSHKADSSCRTVITFKANDHNQNTIMLNKYSFVWKYLKDAFNNGYLRFDDIKSKSAIFDILAVDLYK